MPVRINTEERQLALSHLSDCLSRPIILYVSPRHALDGF